MRKVVLYLTDEEIEALAALGLPFIDRQSAFAPSEGKPAVLTDVDPRAWKEMYGRNSSKPLPQEALDID